MSSTRSKKRTVTGTVTSDGMDKTVVVRADRLVRHPKYGKYVRRTSVYKAHDEANQAHVGDSVEIMETRPVSRTKSWRLVRILRSAEA